MVDHVAEHERRAVEPWHLSQRGQIRLDGEIAVALLPVRHLIPGHGVHLHVEREQVVAPLDALLDDLIEEVMDLDPLTDESALHIGKRRDDRVDGAALGVVAQHIQGHHPGGAAGPAGSRSAHSDLHLVIEDVGGAPVPARARYHR